MQIKEGELPWLIHVRTVVRPHIVPDLFATRPMMKLKANFAVLQPIRFVKKKLP
jgi:hypothetical protein